MGNCSMRSDDYDPAVYLNSHQFEFHYLIGRGGFSRVWSVTHKNTKQSYALKEILKSRVIAKRHVHSVINEKRLLSILKHPFIVNMHHAFQDRDYLYLTIDLKTGGDLRYHFQKHTFTEEDTKFLTSCIILALEYLHSNKIIHRDLKPENLIFDGEGYMHITDFGIARAWVEDNSHEVSGTPGYMAPEVLCKQNHTYAVDWYALGVILYEIITGLRPYLGENRSKIREQILDRQVQLKANNLIGEWSEECVDFVNQLIQRRPQNRLGFNGINEVKNHPWVRNVEWDKLFRKEIKPSFKPPKAKNFNQKYVNEDWKDGIITNSDFSQEIFLGYFYNEMPTNNKDDPNYRKCQSEGKKYLRQTLNKKQVS
ncbi:unnamed protein product [Blepharisma stoltei]|uniref:non-specific serine/threonine protein kinase n=1 Tax=Blepharisma stoltei TaxID=1481888 RepID=A0AAU9JZ25_9CILI|nr:unnamed protein product [Blepharisma stoltei]